jgi:hypothetical protein
MFFGEVFQEVKYWYRHMNIQTLKVVVFRQITLFKSVKTSFNLKAQAIDGASGDALSIAL